MAIVPKLGTMAAGALKNTLGRPSGEQSDLLRPASVLRSGSDVRASLFFAGKETMATTTRPVATEEDLLQTPRDGQKYELVDGEIRVSLAGYLPTPGRRFRGKGPVCWRPRGIW